MSKTAPPSSFIELTTKPSPKNNSYTPEDRQTHCNQWRQSGLSMSEYCRRHQLTVSSLSLWLKHSKNPDKSSPPIPPMARTQSLEVRLVNGSWLLFSEITDVDAIVQLVKAFDTCS